MQYPPRSAHGDAAQYFTAYKITQLFGWPCRLTNADVGIDGEVEIVDDYVAATGDIIKLQIKAIAHPGAAPTVSVYVEDRHVFYWQRFCVPVVVCAVDLTRETIYWRQMTSTETFRSTGAAGKVEFSTTTDLLTAGSRAAWAQFAAPAQSKELPELFAKLRSIESTLPTDIADDSMIDDLIRIDEQYRAAIDLVRKTEALISHYPWRVSNVALGWFQSLQQHLDWIKNRCKELHNAW